MKNLFIIFLALGLITACGGKKNETEGEIPGQTDAAESADFAGLHEKAKTFFGTLPVEAVSPDNPITAEKVALGKKLYFDVNLSKDNTQSCNTCHNLATYGVDNKSFSPGNDGGLGGRNSPTTLNAALHIAQFWDGREPTVEAQAGGPILNPVEMAMPDEKAVIKKLSGLEGYKEMFASAFPDAKPAITYENLKTAIGAFERKLITPSRFDKYLAGDNAALDDKEKKGLQTFIDAGCITCHSGNLLGGAMYQKFGLFGNYWELTKSEKIDNGRFDVTGSEADKYMFKVPSLRNIEKTGPYFHDGSVADLKASVDIMARLQLNKELSGEELDAITAFLSSLTGEIPAGILE